MAQGEFGDLMLIMTVGIFVAFALWLLYRGFRVTTQARLQRAEAYTRLLEKFGSAKEFTDFLQTEQGRRILENPVEAPRSAGRTYIRFAQAGFVLLAIGVAFFMNALRLAGATDPNLVNQAQDCRYWGIFGVVLGIGLILTAFVSMTLARRWHLLNGRQ